MNTITITLHYGMLRNAKFGPRGALLSPCNSGAPGWILIPWLTELPSIYFEIEVNFVRLLGCWVVLPNSSSYSVLKPILSSLALWLRMLSDLFFSTPCSVLKGWLSAKLVVTFVEFPGLAIVGFSTSGYAF
jgi:hypothetical protein